MGLSELRESIKWHNRHTGDVKFVNTLTTSKDGKFCNPLVAQAAPEYDGASLEKRFIRTS